MMYNYSNFQYFSIKDIDEYEKLVLLPMIYKFLFTINFEYPNFYKWYRHLFLNLELNPDRDMIICTNNNSDIAGIAILKYSEKKICTLRVSNKYQYMGIGSKLVEKSFELLNTEKPFITIHISKYNTFKRLFNRYNFSLEQQIPGYYGFLRSELVYNGSLIVKNKKGTSLIDRVSCRIEKNIYEYPESKKYIIKPSLITL